MKSEELRHILKWRLGIDITDAALRKYQAHDLIPQPKHRTGGQGVKRDFPVEAMEQAAATYMVLKKWRISSRELAKARKVAVKFLAGSTEIDFMVICLAMDWIRCVMVARNGWWMGEEK